MEVPVSSDPVVERERKKKKKKKKRKPRKRHPNRLRRRGRSSGVTCRRRRELELLKELSSTQADTTASSSVSPPGSSLVIDLTLSDEDTIELPPSSPLIEVLDTDDCPKVRFPEKIPAEVLDAYLCHYYSGERGISPIVRAWCIQMFCELHPDAPCFGRGRNKPRKRYVNGAGVK